jgi:hypothetical protein
MKRRLILLLLIIICACRQGQPEEEFVSETDRYLKEILDLMEKHSINRKTIDWAVFRDNARQRAGGSIVISDLYPAIKSIIKALGDHHSFYQNGNIVLSGYDLNCAGSSATVSAIDNVGYVKVTSFSGSTEQAIAFATGLQMSIKAQDKAGLKGWIVDLRGNGGGNMWPMVAGIGPLLGEGVLGYFIDPDNNESPWSYSLGSSVAGGNKMTTVTNPYTVIKGNQKVAVLVDQVTASSGEAVAISWIGRPNTKLFGVSTCGLSTANSGYELSDGAWLYLTVAVMADRNKVKQGGPVAPDLTVAGDAEVVAKAVEWLNE